MKPHGSFVRAAAIGAAVVIAAAAWYLGSPLFIRTTADEALPSAAASAIAATGSPPASASGTPAASASGSPEPPKATIRQRGRLGYVDALHNGTGSVLLGVVSGCCPAVERAFLRFEDVAITNAPDVHVYLSRDRGGKWSEVTSAYVGPLKATNGSFNYDLAPALLGGEYQSVVVWCRAFGVLITWADLAPA